MRPELGMFGPLQREIDRLFDDFARGLTVQGNGQLVPNIDVTETDKNIEIAAELPGLERKDVDISLEDNALTIRGEKTVEEERKDEKKNYRVTERSYGAFYRVFELPPGIDPSTVQAAMSKGVLKITIPKPARSEAKKIEVKEPA
jgi:HSP20 family protein